ncbi:RNA-binding protein, putative [Plasmodium berghei]|uniref:RNA-binding protein, putative n=2 Tax=Plasmodium berghei TaxID=5821 RepID=A0A509AVZ2_PLABA|nr:RNA-binding protein, putative [Plasmodium berghei ANKA]CXI89820.1 RNA-binding protein, putative [Plasmodium berghei]SCL96134.1 RNA-binding protein, putative [Plasmodium berghei]SCM16370.1 RNA-binding protein, putative [Plasmodium berghei]SCN27591.1 RNA-binding protein, putative [Plasmodium berghei]VUC57476.1 RNA-binding protein, putative [Plasmodium berghei ANKA]|eukprot:XP_034423247.1 RNA-binding protein, putative [Plasmodium berghei ANKA]
MTDIQIQNQNNNLGTNKKEFDHRFDDKPLRILCVKNIPKETTENELLELFKPFGSIENINLKVNKNVGPYAIYAHVYFSSPEEAKRCLKQMNGKILNGRALRIDYKKNHAKLGDGEEDNNNYNNMGNNNLNNNNKFHKKTNRTNQVYNNQLYNNRYVNNNKRPMRNGFIIGDGLINQHETDINYSREYEPNKRMRMGNFNDPPNINNINNDADLNKLLREYENKKDSNNNEVENIIQTLINGMTHKMPRVKLFLCDHLRKCVQHVFNRPCINITNNNNLNNLTNLNNIPFPGPNHEHKNNIISNLQNYQSINEFEKEKIYNNSNTILWKGVLEMKNKDSLSINAYGLNGDVNNFLNNNIKNIIISHRKKMKNLPKIEAIYHFEIQNEKDINIFESYKNYFNNKDRVGLASANENWHFYIIFPGTPIFNEILNANNNIQTNFNNTFIGVVSYNPQILERNIPRKINPSHDDAPIINTPPPTNNNNNSNNNNNFPNNFPNNTEEHKNSESEINTNDQTENDDNKNELPNWLNQFSSLAAYLVKK